MNPSLREHQLVEDHSRLTISWMTGNWTPFWQISNSLRTAEDSRKCRWLGLGLNVEKPATRWPPLKTQENVDDWDLDLVMRNQRLIEHYSTLKNLLMIETWNHLWEISNSLITTQDSRKCRWLGLRLTFEKSAAAWWHRQLLGTFLPTVGGTQPILCLGIGMITQHGPVPVWAKTTLWHSRVTLVD